MAASNWNQVPTDIIFDLVADANSGFGAVRSNFTFKDNGSGGYLSTSVPEGSTKNTSAVITPTVAAAATYEGDVTITYDRLTVAAYLTGVTGSQTFDYTPDDTAEKPYLTATSSSADILVVLRLLLGIQIQDNQDFDNTLYNLTEVTAGTQYTLTLSPKSETGFLFQGQAETITVNQPVKKTQTSDVVQTTEMNGLEAPTSGE